MDELTIFRAIFDSWNKPIVFVNTDHIIEYMNAPAKNHYAKWGNSVGKSIFDCHNEKSTRIIKDAFVKLEDGEEEVLIGNNKKHRVYMRGARDDSGKLIGYYERYDPSLGK